VLLGSAGLVLRGKGSKRRLDLPPGPVGVANMEDLRDLAKRQAVAVPVMQ
jgi:hypothetical protein